MRRAFLFAVILASARAHADVEPTVALRAGGHHTSVGLSVLDLGDSYGDPRGEGLAAEVETGVRLHAQWSLTAFFDLASFHTTLHLEYPEPFDRSPFNTRFRERYVGGRVTWRPLPRLFVAAGVGSMEVRQRDKAVTDGYTIDTGWRDTLVELRLSAELFRRNKFSAQISIAIATNPFKRELFTDGVELYVPLLAGIVWN